MHLSDALISFPVAGTMYAVSGLLLAFSVHEVKQDYKDRRIPVMGISGAFIFAAQMLNFSIPGTGSSGHICGAILLSVLFGVAPAFIIMSGVLLIQALFFGDGGLLAYGCNLFNMAFFGCFFAGPYIFKPIAGNYMCRWKVFFAGIVSGIAAALCGAFTVTLQTLISGVTRFPFPVFLSFMLPIHALIGVAEGLATACVVLFVQKNMPQIASLECVTGEKKFLRAILVFSLATIIMGGGLSFFASSNPDGLEWSIEKTAFSTHQQNPLQVSEHISGFSALLDNYTIPGMDSHIGVCIAGIVGCLLSFLLFIVIFTFIARLCKHHSVQGSFHEY